MNAWDHPLIKKGMEAQLAKRRARIAAGERPLGWKVGLGAPASMERLGIKGPGVGYLMQRALVLSGGTVSFAGWTKPVAEAEICVRMADDSPDKYLVNMSKAKRKGKIFLDYLRNDRMSTAVAPLSPRAREGATVSMPLEWSQIKKGLDPKRFTVRSVPALLAKSTAWKDYDKGTRPLMPVLKKLAGK